MKITIEVSSEKEMEKILKLFKELEMNQITVSSQEPNKNLDIQKGNKKINPRDLFGIWKDNPKTIEDIRKNAWKRNWGI